MNRRPEFHFEVKIGPLAEVRSELRVLSAAQHGRELIFSSSKWLLHTIPTKPCALTVEKCLEEITMIGLAMRTYAGKRRTVLGT